MAANVAVYVVPAASAAVGVSVAVVVAASYETLAATAPPGPASVNDVLVSVAGFIARENVADTAVPVDTPVAPSAGLFAVTVGAGVCVVNDHETGDASATPSAAFTVAASAAV